MIATYSVAYFLTVITESAVILVLKGFSLKKYSYYLVLSCAVVSSVITYPWAFYFYRNFKIPLSIIECLVVLVEALIWNIIVSLTYKKAILISILTNLSSVLLGYLVNVM
jgi:hypothetical protein